ncbi:hypothetical protein ABZP36_018206 [Zizania latifolia]
MASAVRDTTAAVGDGAAPPQPEAATRGRATMSVTAVLLVLLGAAFVAAFLMSSWVEDGAGGGGESKGAEPVEQALGHDTPGFNSRMDTFRAWAKLALMKIRRPHSDEPRYGSGGCAGSAAEAAKKSFEMGKETMEQAAATTARAAEDAAAADAEL